jgi:glycosyltransferase involved in cell wall biosynthesis
MNATQRPPAGLLGGIHEVFQSDPLKRIAIFEMAAGGHHPAYVRLILEACASDGTEWTIAAPSAMFNKSELRNPTVAFSAFSIPVSPQMQIRLQDTSFKGLTRREFIVRDAYAAAFREMTRYAPIDLAILPYACDCLNAIAIKGSPFDGVPWIGVDMRARFHFSKMNVIAPQLKGRWLREALFRRALAIPKLTTMFTIDPSLVEFGSSQNWKNGDKLVHLRDPGIVHPLSDKAAAREALRIPADAVVILVYGALSARKGVFSLMSAANHSNCNRRVHVLMVGEQDRDVQRFVSGPVGLQLEAEGRLHQVRGFASPETESLVLSAADVMWTAYTGFYQMSGVVVLAARHGLASLVSEEGIAGYLARRNGFGWRIDPGNLQAVVEVLNKIPDNLNELRLVGEKGRVFFDSHSPANFVASFREAIAKAARVTTHG